MLRIYFISTANVHMLSVGIAKLKSVQGSDRLFNLMKGERFIARVAFLGIVPEFIWMDEVFIGTLKEINV